MKRLITLLIAFASINVYSQTPEDFRQQYLRQTKVAGSSGLGVKTILDRWETAYPNDTTMLEASFLYYLGKARTSTVVPREQKSYLGKVPTLSLKDSTGRDVHYYELSVYSEEPFALSQKYLDRAITTAPHNIGYRFYEITALLDYEGESPDMAATALQNLIDYNYSESPAWVMNGKLISEQDFIDYIQEYCYAFWNLGTPTGYESFFAVSLLMNSHNPKNVGFIDNLGSYYQVYKKNYKKAEIGRAHV